MRPNAHVQTELARLRDEWDRGAVEGYETPLTTRPAFVVNRYTDMTAYQRGYLLGRELRQREEMDRIVE